VTRRGPPKDVAASIRARLHNVARERGEDFQFVLLRYGAERLLYRLTRSAHAGQFVLKGSALFVIWLGHPHRPTRDIDLLGTGTPTGGCSLGLVRSASVRTGASWSLAQPLSSEHPSTRRR